jgi:hypothetical protein
LNSRLGILDNEESFILRQLSTITGIYLPPILVLDRKIYVYYHLLLANLEISKYMELALPGKNWLW